MIRTALAILVASAAPSVADVAFLNWPIDCALGDTCVIAHYPDVDPGPGAQDYRCGRKTYDGHSGTDIRLVTPAAMETGIAVRAAADGRVEAIRDMRPDQPYVPGTPLDGAECGNAVRIAHANGFQTVYCHLKLGSVRVSPGQRVLAGQEIGLVGLSGLTDIPHLHLTVTQGADIVDPFAPTQANACKDPSDTLWLQPPAYTDAGLGDLRLSSEMPTLGSDAEQGPSRTEFDPSDALVLTASAYEADAGDRLHLELTGPHGTMFEQTLMIDADQPELFRSIGRRAPEGGWPGGALLGTATLVRGNSVLATAHVRAQLR